MNKLAENLLYAHRNPIVKVNIIGNKIFIPKNSEEEKELVDKNIKILSDTIKQERVERRCARMKAIWLPEKNLAKIIKASGSQKFGFQDKSGIYLYPEEVLHLLETNHLEVFWENVPLSIQQGYNIIINDISCNLMEYAAYKKMLIQGYKLVRTKYSKYEECEDTIPRKKLKLDKNSETKSVAKNSDENTKTKDIKEQEKQNKVDAMIQNIFERLHENAPKEYSMKIDKLSKYQAQNSDKMCSFNLFITNDKEMDPQIGFYKEPNANIFAIISPDSVAYYRFSSATLPTLL